MSRIRKPVLVEKVTIPEQEALKIRCNRCQNVWYYRGSNKYAAHCTRCHTTILLMSTKEEL